MANTYLYTPFLTKLLNGGGIDLDTDTIKVALLTSAYTPSKLHSTYADVSGSEVANGNGYATGGATLGSKTVTQDNTNFWATWDAADPSWPSSIITARYAVFYKSTGTPSTSFLIALVDFGSNLSTNNSDFSVAINASGILRALEGS